MRRYFVTGTDTGVGKTHVAAAMARRARKFGKSVFAFKPIETGCGDGDLGEDQRELVEAAGGWQRDELAGVYRLKQPVAPAVAAKAEGIEIDLQRISTLAGSQTRDLVLVEGAGGWRVPLTQRADIAALAKLLGYPVIVVARASLGTINHSLLTVDAVGRDGGQVAALILSQRPTDDQQLAESNVQEIASRWPGPVILFRDDDAVLDCSTWNI